MNMFKFLNDYIINGGDLTWISEAIKKQFKDDIKGIDFIGIMSGWKVNENDTWFVDIYPGKGHDANGESLETTDTVSVNCETDITGASVIPTVGYRRYISIFARWYQKEGDEVGKTKSLTKFKKHLLDGVEFIVVRGEEFHWTTDPLPTTLPVYENGIRIKTYFITNSGATPFLDKITSGMVLNFEDASDVMYKFIGDKIDLTGETAKGGVMEIANIVDPYLAKLSKEMTLTELTSGFASYKILDLQVDGTEAFGLYFLDPDLGTNFNGGLALLRNIRVVSIPATYTNDKLQLIDAGSIGRATIFGFNGEIGSYTKEIGVSVFEIDDFEGYTIMSDSFSVSAADDIDLPPVRTAGTWVNNSGTAIKKERIYGAVSGWKDTTQGVVDIFLRFPYAANRMVSAGIPTVSDVAITTVGATGVTTSSFFEADNNGVTIRFRNSTGTGTSQLMTWRGYILIS